MCSDELSLKHVLRAPTNLGNLLVFIKYESTCRPIISPWRYKMHPDEFGREFVSTWKYTYG